MNRSRGLRGLCGSHSVRITVNKRNKITFCENKQEIGTNCCVGGVVAHCRVAWLKAASGSWCLFLGSDYMNTGNNVCSCSSVPDIKRQLITIVMMMINDNGYEM